MALLKGHLFRGHLLNQKGYKMRLEKYVSMLGYKCRDKISGVEGIITHIGFDLYGCIQAIVHPGKNKEGQIQETIWLDVMRIEIISKDPVMPQPEFELSVAIEAIHGLRGPSEKPRMKKA